MANARLTNDVRNLTVAAALRASFNPRIDALSKSIQDFTKAEVARLHPTFIKLARDKDARPYLGIRQNPKLAIVTQEGGRDLTVVMRKPRNIGAHISNETAYMGHYAPDGYTEMQGSCDYPDGHGLIAVGVDHPLAVEFRALWADYFAAMSALRETLFAYTVREAFEQDFPELAKYLPVRPSPVRALAIPVADLRSKLAAVGVPPEVQP